MTQTDGWTATSLTEIRQQALDRLAGLATAGDAVEWERDYLGPKGAVKLLQRSLGQLPAEERPAMGRAANELSATGARRPLLAGERNPILTPQEYEIAMLAASGLSNKQIGSRLYLSPRTVGAHLYRVFPKLGVTSRAALRDALSAAGKPDDRVASRAG